MRQGAAEDTYRKRPIVQEPPEGSEGMNDAMSWIVNFSLEHDHDSMPCEDYHFHTLLMERGGDEPLKIYVSVFHACTFYIHTTLNTHVALPLA